MQKTKQKTDKHNSHPKKSATIIMIQNKNFQWYLIRYQKWRYIFEIMFTESIIFLFFIFRQL